MTTVAISSQLWEEGRKLFEDDVGVAKGERQQDSTSLQQTIESLKHASTKASKEYGEHSIRKDKKPIITIKLDRIMKRLEVLMQIGDAYIGCAPETVSLVWMSFRMIFTGFLKDAATCAWLTDAVDQISDIMFVCNVFEQRYLKSNGIIDVANVAKDRVLATIPPLYAAVMKFSYQSRKLFAHGKLIRSFMSWRSAELEDTLGDAQAKRAKLQETAGIGFQEATLDTLQALKVDTSVIHGVFEVLQSEVVSGIKEIQADQAKSKEVQRKAEIEKRYNKHLDWLKTGHIADLAAPGRVQETNIKKRHPGSTDWLLESHEFIRWRDTSSASVTWLWGNGGFGKSVLVSSMIDHIRNGEHRWSNNRAHVIFFYCKKGDAAASAGKRIFLHLLIQLYERASHTGASLDLQEKYADLVEEAQKSSKSEDKHDASLLQLKSTLLPLFNNLVKGLDLPVFVFVDALDETEDDDGQFIQALLQLPESSNVHLMLTSRPEVFLQLKQPENHVHVHGIEVSAAQTQAEIAKYVKANIKSIKRFTPPMRKKACGRIAERSEGSFRYADVVLDSLSQPAAKTTPFNQLMESLPNGMNALYRQSMAALESSHRDMLITALRWLMCSSEQITIDMIADELEGRWDIIEQDKNSANGESSDDGDDSGYSDFESDSEAGEVFRTAREPTPFNDEGVQRDIDKDLQVAGRDFLVMDKRYRWIDIQHNSVRDFILSEEEAIKHEVERCQDCKKRFQETLAFEAGPKHGLFIICQKIVRRLNNPEFQKEFILPSYRSESQLQSLASSRRPSVADHDSVASEPDARKSPAKKDIFQLRDIDGKDNKKKGDMLVNSIEIPHSGPNDGNPPTSSVPGSPPQSPLSEPPPPPPVWINRYEVTAWPKHFRQLEEITEEKPDGWTELFDDLQKFLQPESHVYKAWQWAYFSWRIFPPYDSPLHLAAKFGIVELIKRCLDEGKYDINSSDELTKETPLHLACLAEGNFRAIEILCDRGADVNAADHNGMTPLLILLQNKGNISDVERLFKAGAKTDVKNDLGETPLHLAAQSCNIEIMKKFLGLDGIDVNIKDTFRGETPLHWAFRLENPSTEFLELLIAKGARVNEQDFDSQGPLYEACQRGDANGAAVLLKHGADIDDDEDVFGRTALHAAINAKSPDAVKVMVDAGASLEFRNKNGEDALFQAVMHANVEVFNLICDGLTKIGKFQESCLAQENLEGMTPLHIADTIEILKTLLEKGDAPKLLSIKDRTGDTPLHRSAERCYPDIIQALLDAGADPKAKNNSNRMPAELAMDTWANCSPWDFPSSDFVNSVLLFVDRAPDAVKMPELLNVDIRSEIETPICGMYKHLYQVEDDHGWTPLALAEHLKRQYKLDRLLEGQQNPPQARRVVGHRPSGINPTPCHEVGNRKFRLSENALGVSTFPEDLSPENSENEATTAEGSQVRPILIESSDSATVDAQPTDQGKSDRSDQGHLDETKDDEDNQSPDDSGSQKAGSVVSASPSMISNRFMGPKELVVIADHPAPACMPVYYYEVEVLAAPAETGMNIGFTHNPDSRVNNDGLWAWGANYESKPAEESVIFTNSATLGQPDFDAYFPYHQGDVLGCGYDWESEIVFFTKNGNLIKEGLLHGAQGQLYPCATLYSDNIRLRFNFGNESDKPFKYNDSNKTLKEKDVDVTPSHQLPRAVTIGSIPRSPGSPLSRTNSVRSGSVNTNLDDLDTRPEVVSVYLRISGSLKVPKYTMESAREAANLKLEKRIWGHLH